MTVTLTALADVIQRESGIVIKASQLPSLQAAITRVDPYLTAEELIGKPVPAEIIERLIDQITIRETFFFRHLSELKAIDWYAMLESARARGSNVVRVWIAGCASGEEAYTVAILACEAFASSSPPVRVLGTDIAPTALRQARAGRYGKRAVNTLPPAARERYFTTKDEVTCVGERLRGLVEFRRHNLVGDPLPPAGEQPFDVILCRNVLIYFDRPTVERVLEALERALAPAGLLLLGAADRLSGQARPAVPAKATAITRRPSHPSSPTPRAPLHPPGGDRAPTQIKGPLRRVQQAEQREPPSLPTPADAVKAADRGELELAVQIATDALAQEPLNAEAHYIRGVAELARKDPRAAVEPLRRALYIDPNFSLAAFKLARAHDELGEAVSARRAYERTLRTLDHTVASQAQSSGHLDLLDMAAACHTRLQALSGKRAGG